MYTIFYHSIATILEIDTSHRRHTPNKTAVLTIEWTIDDSSRAIEEQAELFRV